LCEGGGLPIGVAVDGANRHDMKLVRQTVESIPIERPEPHPEHPQNLCLDAGYDYDEVRSVVAEFGYVARIRSRSEEAQACKRQPGSKARRWVVERTHSWLNRHRRILIRWEKKPENYLAMLHLACSFIVYRTLFVG
jgi:transposase